MSLIREQDASLSVIGLAKNVGKTTVLNALVYEANTKGFTSGLLSIGVDGEERDVWSGLPKPALHVPRGFLVATAAPCIEEQESKWELLQGTSHQSTLGPTLIARALEDTHVKLAGITTTSQVIRIMAQFQQWGAPLTLVDGAYDRRATANPWVTQETICVVGASISSSLEEIMQKTREAIHIFTLPQVTHSMLRQAGEEALRTRKIIGVGSQGLETLSHASLLGNWEQIQRTILQREWTGLAFPGALTEGTLQRIASFARPLQLCIMEPTRCFVSGEGLRKFYRQGGKVVCLQGISLRAIAINPYSPGGWEFDPEEMVARIQEVSGTVPVINVLRGQE